MQTKNFKTNFMPKSRLLLIFATLILAGAGCVSSQTQTDSDSSQGLGFSPVEIPDTAKPIATEALPNLTFTDYEGNSVRLHDFIGTPLIVNSWAAWCPFCKRELKDFAAVQRELGEQAKFIAIDRAESLATAKRYSDELGVTQEMIFLLDPRDSFYQAIGGFSMPETIFVNARGEIVAHRRGPMDLSEVRERTQRLLAP